MKRKVVDLRQYREDNTPHLSGFARCLACKHEWAAVSPVGTVAFFECPNCGLPKGCYKFPVVKDTSHWTCYCGNDFFHLSLDGVYCPNCGVWQHGWEDDLK